MKLTLGLKVGICTALLSTLATVAVTPKVQGAGSTIHTAQDGRDAVHLDGGQALVRFKGMTVLVDPDAATAELAPVDLVLLRGCGAVQLAWLARQRLDRAVAVVATPGGQCATEVRGQGVRRIQVLGMWGAYTLKLGAGAVRLTVMPAMMADGPEAGAPDLAAVPGVMMDFSDSQGASYRIYAGGETDGPALAALPARFPGADMAIVRRDGAPVLAAVEARRDGSRVMREVALNPEDPAYGIVAVKRR
ncbi:hypothetical protein GCM10027277_14150 [Pseudoduganella ginsengisoli]|uniref:Uncharacterized protein n=1 Tax=Pseudoduganella ginsengisoli TaxID=1462440 RepID=A0A6L6PW15_9BURK|nr:hypothetical protein [Pseudoduganella ginsengisoli]MTW01324.1 hypothetical protein [Pseudoduganella ginsengisoli]